MKIGRCIHCLRAGIEVNDDHVFPESWYSPNVPKDVEKWVAPSCVPCNSSLGKIENELLVKFGYCVDPDSPTTADVVARAIRATDPSAARPNNPRDIKARERFRDRLAFEATLDAPEGRSLPFFSERWGRPKEEQVYIRIPGADLRRFIEKIVRGIHYVADQRFVDSAWIIDVYPMGESVAGEVALMLGPASAEYSIAPAITVRRFSPIDAEDWSICSIDIWDGAMKFWAAVIRRPPLPELWAWSGVTQNAGVTRVWPEDALAVPSELT